MKTKLGIAGAVMFCLLLLSGCFGTIETGNVGVRTTFGTVNPEEVQPGFYIAIFSSVDEFTSKETNVTLENLTPKAKDNLSLRDLDVSIFYRVNGSAVADLYIKYAGQHARGSDGYWYPVYNLVTSLARGATYAEVAKMDSLVLHTKREEIEAGIQQSLQAELDKNDKGNILISRVVIRALSTDQSIEESIRQAVAAQKQLEQIEVQNKIAVKQAEIKVTQAKGIAESNRIINSTLTREYLQHELNQVLEKFAENKNGTIVIPAHMNVAPLINIPARSGADK